MASPSFTTTILLFLLSVVIATAGAEDLQSDRAALLTFYDYFRPHQLHWNATASPCSWTGIGCTSGRVTSLRLPGIDLNGPIPPGSIGNLTALRTLSLRLNSLSGPLPSDFTGAARLRQLYLQHNLLSGEIPRSFSALKLLERLNLEYNNFSGTLPDIHLPILTKFNASYNHLTGQIPAGFLQWPASAFLDMPLCGGSLAACVNNISPAEAPAPHSAPPKLSIGDIALIIVAAVIVGPFLVVGFIVLIVYCKRESIPVALENVVEEGENAVVNDADVDANVVVVPAQQAKGGQGSSKV